MQIFLTDWEWEHSAQGLLAYCHRRRLCCSASVSRENKTFLRSAESNCGDAILHARAGSQLCPTIPGGCAVTAVTGVPSLGHACTARPSGSTRGRRHRRASYRLPFFSCCSFAFCLLRIGYPCKYGRRVDIEMRSVAKGGESGLSLIQGLKFIGDYPILLQTARHATWLRTGYCSAVLTGYDKKTFVTALTLSLN